MTMTDRQPSEAVITLNRVTSSGSFLIGSPLEHRSFVSLSIAEAAVRGGVGDERVMSGKGVVEVYMTHEQFSRFISCWGTYPGTSCTLSRREGVSVEPPTRAKSERERGAEHTDRRFREIESAARAIGEQVDQIVDKPRVSKGDVRALGRLVQQLVTEVTANLPYLARQMEERMARTVASAGAEAAGLVSSIIQSAGLGAVADQVRSQLPGQPLFGKVITEDPVYRRGDVDALLCEPVEFEPEEGDAVPGQGTEGYARVRLAQAINRGEIPAITQVVVEPSAPGEAGLEECATRIDRHLKRIEAEQPPASGDGDYENTVGRLFSAGASVRGRGLKVVYVSYQSSWLDPSANCTLWEAREYLAALDGGYTGRHGSVQADRASESPK